VCYKGTPQSHEKSLSNGRLEIFDVLLLEGDFTVERDDGADRGDLFAGDVRGALVRDAELRDEFVEEGETEVACHHGDWHQRKGHKPQFPTKRYTTPKSIPQLPDKQDKRGDRVVIRNDSPGGKIDEESENSSQINATQAGHGSRLGTQHGRQTPRRMFRAIKKRNLLPQYRAETLQPHTADHLFRSISKAPCLQPVSHKDDDGDDQPPEGEEVCAGAHGCDVGIEEIGDELGE
jgi:hypothetical protein